MLNFTHFHLENYVLFNDIQWQFTKGVTFLLGRNKHRRDPNASNAAGKSLLFGALSSALFDTHPVITKNSRSVQKAMYDKSKVSVCFTKDDNTYEYCKSDNKVALYCNGKDTISRIGRQQLENLLGFTEAEFFSTIHVDGRRTHNFLLGNTSDRVSFLTNLFRLYDMDELRLVFGRKLHELCEVSAVHAMLQSKLVDIVKEYRSYPQDDTKLVNAQHQLTALHSRISKCQSFIHQHAAADSYIKVKKQLEAIPIPDIDHAIAKEGLKASIQYTSWLSDRRAAQQELAYLEKTVGERAKNYKKAIAAKESLGALRCTMPEKVDEPTMLVDTNLQELQSKIAILRDNLAQVRQSLQCNLDADCPTCLRKIDSSSYNSIKTALKLKKAKIEKALTIYSKRLSLCQQTIIWKEYTIAQTRWKVYQKYKKAVDNFPFAQIERLYALQKCVTANVKAPAHTLREYENALALHEKRKQLTSLLKTLQPTEFPSIPKAMLEKHLKRYQKTASLLSLKLPKLTSQHELKKRARVEIVAIKKQIKEYTILLRDMPVYELLHKAYSTSGIKRLILTSICKTLETNINKYSKLIFEEGFSFKIDPITLSILVKRRYGKPSDIRYFSGAESRLFAIVFLLALLPMIPSNRRANILILDEPSANMDTGSLETFRDVILPKLAKIVPSIVVITPNQELVPHNANCYTVVKHGGYSTLVKGIV